MNAPFSYRKLLQYFLQGLLVLAPVAITAYALYFIVSSIDSWIPIFTSTDEKGVVRVQNYGIGFLLIIPVTRLPFRAIVRKRFASGRYSSFFAASTTAGGSTRFVGTFRAGRGGGFFDTTGSAKVDPPSGELHP